MSGMMNWPKQAEVLALRSVYGNPRNPRDPAKSSPNWEVANLVYVKAPFAMFFGGKVLSRGCKVHRHCAASLGRIFGNLMDAAGGRQEELDWWGVTNYGGGHNFRLMTGGRSLSMHSFGCAIDLDPPRNGWKDRTPRFLEFPEVLKAFREERWRWGGDWDGDGTSADERFADGMHWQATQ